MQRTDEPVVSNPGCYNVNMCFIVRHPTGGLKVNDSAGENTGKDQFIVWCEVSGGVTGARQGPLKLNGEPMLFESELLARQAAEDAYNAVTRNASSTARYRYTVRLASTLGAKERGEPTFSPR